MKDTLKIRNGKVKKITPVLDKLYPDTRCLLDFKSPLQLLVATILAAQCTDVRVNMVTPGLFKQYKTARHFADAKPPELEQQIRSIGCYRNKTKSILKMTKTLVEDFKGKVPQTMKELTALAGVGRKTANVVLGNCFDTPGIIVDTHFLRVTGRIGLTTEHAPEKIETDLQQTVPQKQWTHFSHLIGFHGRAICKARKPDCPNCKISRWCDWFKENGESGNG